MERLLIFLATNYSHFAVVSDIWSLTVCSIHNDYVGYTIECHLEWWNGNKNNKHTKRQYICHVLISVYFLNHIAGHRTIEKRRSQLGEKAPLEEYTIGIWSVLNGLVFAIHKTSSQIKVRHQLLLSLNKK